VDTRASAGAPESRPRLGAISARQPANKRTEREPDLRRERHIGGHADDDAQHQPQHGSKRDRGSNAHMRESMASALRATIFSRRKALSAPGPL
jgi:hypothetical protein